MEFFPWWDQTTSFQLKNDLLRITISEDTLVYHGNILGYEDRLGYILCYSGYMTSWRGWDTTVLVRITQRLMLGSQRCVCSKSDTREVNLNQSFSQSDELGLPK